MSTLFRSCLAMLTTAIPDLTESERDILRKALGVESTAIECLSPGIIRVDGKQTSLQPRCWKVLNHVVRYGPTSVDKMEQVLSETENEEIELDNDSVRNIVCITNTSLRKMNAKECLSARGGSFALQKLY